MRLSAWNDLFTAVRFEQRYNTVSLVGKTWDLTGDKRESLLLSLVTLFICSLAPWLTQAFSSWWPQMKKKPEAKCLKWGCRVEGVRPVYLLPTLRLRPWWMKSGVCSGWRHTEDIKVVIRNSLIFEDNTSVCLCERNDVASNRNPQSKLISYI